jgi:DnaJ-class molecular chaperone
LKDPTRRRQYDLTGDDNPNAQMGGGFHGMNMGGGFGMNI